MTDIFNDQSEKPPVTFEQFLHMARDEHPQVVKMLKRKARRLGETLGWIFAVHQPDRIKLSGHIPDAAPYVCDAFWYGVKRRLSREGDTSLEYLQNVRTLGLCGSCRMALHIRFNEPLLGIVSDDQVQSHESLMSQSF